jgi:hypothetical protein
MSLLNTGQSRNESWTPYFIVVYQRLDFTSVYIINTISKWRNSLPNVCHPWLNNGVIYSCSALIPELLCYLLIRDIFLIMKLVIKLLYKYSLNDNLFRIVLVVRDLYLFLILLCTIKPPNAHAGTSIKLLHASKCHLSLSYYRKLHMNWYLFNEVTCLLRPFFLYPKGDLLIQVLSILTKILSLINFCTINKINHDLQRDYSLIIMTCSLNSYVTT